MKDICKSSCGAMLSGNGNHELNIQRTANVAKITHNNYKYCKYNTQLLQIWQILHTIVTSFSKVTHKFCKYYTESLQILQILHTIINFFSQILHTIIIINLILQVLHTNAHFSILTHF